MHQKQRRTQQEQKRKEEKEEEAIEFGLEKEEATSKIQNHLMSED